MKMREDPDDPDLDAVFAAARAEEQRPPGALLARVLADAEATTAAARPVRQRLGAALLQALGGWPAAAGLAAACAAGVALGLAAPAAVPFFGTEAAYDLIDLAPGYAALAAFEG